MTLTDRDRRIMLVLIPIVLLVGYWFLLLSPKRDDLKTAQDAQAQAEARRDQAEQRVALLERARQTFAADYAAVVRLGKAIPSTIDAPSLLIQLDQAAEGTRIDFNSVTFGARASGIAAPATPTAPAQDGAAAPGGDQAQTAPGQAAEGAGETAEQANQQQDQSAQAQQGVDAATTPPSEEAATGTEPAAPATTATPQSQATPGALESVALTFDFTGTYFDLADFFHRLKRFVYVQDDRIFIRGRLLTIDSLTFGTSASGEAAADNSGELTTTVGATVYLSSRTEGITAGATPAGPAGAPTETAPAPGTARRGPGPVATAVAGR